MESFFNVPALVEHIAGRVLEQVREEIGSREEDRWMNTRDAAAYLGLSVDAIHKKTGPRAIPFHQDVENGKCWFLRSELDAWRRGGG